MNIDQVGRMMEVVYHKGLFWDHFIDDIDEVLYEITKFADNTKISI